MNNMQVSNILLILLTVLSSAFFSGMEIAFITSNKLKIELDKSKGMSSARILSAFNKKPSRLIGALLLGNNIALVIYGIVMANLLDPLILSYLPLGLHSEIIVLLVQTIIATLIILFFAEFLPKVLFRINSNAIVHFFAIPLWIIYYFLYPLVYIFTSFSEWILKVLFKVHFDRDELVFTPIDLDEYLREFASDEHHMEEVQQEIQMFQNVLEFRNVKLKECMVPRPEIIAVEEKDPVDMLRLKFIEHGVSRIPVYVESIDNIVGYVHSFDMFKNPADIQSIINPILYAPETMLANTVMKMFIQQHKNIAVVVDEFGGTSGMVTMEDVIEEIFGEIQDEFDAEELVEKVVNDAEYIFSARLEIDYLNDKYKLGLPEADDYETLAGLIIQFHESIPSKGQTIMIKPFIFEILQASESRIELVKLKFETEE